MHSASVQFFGAMASQDNIDEESVRINKWNNHSVEDAEFILQYVTSESSLLDMASGSGLIVNKLYPHVKRILAVELFPAFTQFIVDAPNIEIIHDDVLSFTTEEQFNVITCFGIMHYLNRNEAKSVYAKLYRNLLPNGVLIIKQQFGVYEDVRVQTTLAHFADEEYHSEYRYIDSEVKLLEQIGYTNIDIIDIYPSEYNKWENTHFYALVAHI